MFAPIGFRSSITLTKFRSPCFRQIVKGIITTLQYAGGSVFGHFCFFRRTPVRARKQKSTIMTPARDFAKGRGGDHKGRKEGRAPNEEKAERPAGGIIWIVGR